MNQFNGIMTRIAIGVRVTNLFVYLFTIPSLLNKELITAMFSFLFIVYFGKYTRICALINNKV